MERRDGHVRVLPVHVANKIAAGEVVERPASVVKELVENAIDAGAKNIKICLSQGGRKLVSVQDDGCGMTRDDATLSLERQATSKILDVDDIERIDTLGFRGEAIPSIASVSRFSMSTRRREDDEGTFIAVNAGVLAEVRAAGCPPGTLVEVRDLFCNVPARRKFLRAFVTEENHVRRVFAVNALAHPSVGFSLHLDGREAANLPPASSLEERVGDLFGPDFAPSMLKLSLEGPVSVSGYIEKPGLSLPTRREQYVFVNSRPASAPAIACALREAYPRRQGDARPAAVIFVSVPPEMVDVNVHPAKREVRFRDNSAVRDALEKALRTALAGNLAPASQPYGRPETAAPLQAAAQQDTPSQPAPLPRFQETPAAAESPIPGLVPYAPKAPPPCPAPVQAEFSVDPAATSSKPWRWFRFLALADCGYLLVETDGGIVTVDPRAARERIVFETLCDGAARGAASQPLLVPETATFPPHEAARIRAAEDALSAMGFAIEEFGRDSFKIDAVPQALEGSSAAAMLETIVRDLADGGAARGAKWREEAIAKSVAKAFAGASRALDPDGAAALVEELASCRMPYVCPRGRPTMIFTSVRELDRKFGRI